MRYTRFAALAAVALMCAAPVLAAHPPNGADNPSYNSLTFGAAAPLHNTNVGGQSVTIFAIRALRGDAINQPVFIPAVRVRFGASIDHFGLPQIAAGAPRLLIRPG